MNVTTTLPIGKLFDIMSQYEKLCFHPYQEQFFNSDLKVQNENNQWIPITGGIVKNDYGCKVMFSDGSTVHGAMNHLIRKDSSCVYLKDLSIGDALVKADGTVVTVVSIENSSDTRFYDICVDSETHLYQTSNGLVHHNTELAKLLAEKLQMKLHRYDMTEYQESHSISKLIGAPPGYVGHDDGKMGGGLLIGDIEKNPNSILLFDEVEKAHPNVLQILLQMMDEGFVSGSNGKRADCRNCLILLTSNLGAQDLERNNIGFGQDLSRVDDGAAVRDFFKPEFRNRLDGICRFNSLDQLSYRKIVVKFVKEINDLMSDRGVEVVPTEQLIDYIIETGVDARMGARPLYRKVNDLIKLPLSKKLLFENLPTGTKLWLDWQNNQLMILEENPNVDCAEQAVS